MPAHGHPRQVCTAQELGGRNQEPWAPATGEPRVLRGQSAGAERLDHRVTVDPPDGTDIGTCDRLLVCDDRQRKGRAGLESVCMLSSSLRLDDDFEPFVD
jgi:hypothetical protein